MTALIVGAAAGAGTAFVLLRVRTSAGGDWTHLVGYGVPVGAFVLDVVSTPVRHGILGFIGGYSVVVGALLALILWNRRLAAREPFVETAGLSER